MTLQRRSSDSSTNSDRMSEDANDVILILHAPDGSRWSQFMISKIESPPYEIRCIDKDLTILEDPPEDEDDADQLNASGAHGNGEDGGEEEGEEEGDLYINTGDVAERLRSDSLKSETNATSDTKSRRAPTCASRSANSAKRSDSGFGSTTLRYGGGREGEEEEETFENDDEFEDDGVKPSGEAPDSPPVPDHTPSRTPNSPNSSIKPKRSSSSAKSTAITTSTTPSTTTTPTTAITNASSIDDCIYHCRACIIFLSPDIIESERQFPIDIAKLHPYSTVFLFLGVEINEVYQYFGAQSGLVSKCRCCLIDGSEITIKDSLVEIVRAYENPGRNSGWSEGSTLPDAEDDPDPYVVPPDPVQANRVERLFPRELTGEDREVHFLLKLAPEDKVVVEVGPRLDEVPLKKVCDRFFSFTVPEGLSGNVSFVVGSNGRTIGKESVRVLSRLDQLSEILAQETQPRSLVARAVGVTPGDERGIDTALALRLQQLASAETFARLFPVEEGLQQGKGQGKTSLYPSLLHFAADLNLQTFCSELLRFPGMAGAVRQENSEGETPIGITARKQHRQLQASLEEFARRHGGVGAANTTTATTSSRTAATEEEESGLYVQPSSPRTTAPPPPHRPRTSSGYVNDAQEAKGDYVVMNELHPGKLDLLDIQPQFSLSGVPSIWGPGADDDGLPDMSTFKNEKLDARRSSSTKSSPRDPESPSSPQDSPRTANRKACKILGVTEDEVKRESSSPPVKERNRFFSESSPRGFGLPDPSNKDSSSEKSDSFDTASVKSKGGMLGRIKRGIMPKSKRSSSITEGEKTKLKLPEGAGKRRGSESSINSNTLLRMKSAQEERDSGSYSDEEKEKKPEPFSKRNNKKGKVFKEKEDAWKRERRQSRREIAAQNETIQYFPTLPDRRRRKGAFKSFIDK